MNPTTPLLDLVAHVIDKGFADPSLGTFLLSADTPDAAMDLLRSSLA